MKTGTREAGGVDAKLTVSLLPDDRSAVGYVIQARKRDEGGSLVLGEFAAGSDDSARTHSCGGHENVVLSGRGASMKTTAYWQAPTNWTDAVVFRALVLRKHEGSARYVVVASDPVVIGRVPRVSKLAASLRNAELVPADEEPKTTHSPIMSPGESNVVAQRKSLEKDEENKDGGGGTDNGCGVTKGCFGLPDGCIPQGDCEVMVSYIAEEDGYHFELTGPADKDQMYIAAGISETNKMELTSVIECLRMADKTSIRESWNSQGTTNNVMQQTTEGITFGSHGVTDGVLKCAWVRKAVTTVNAVTFDLAKTKYFVLAAKGQLVPPDTKIYHEKRAASKETLSFGEKRLAKGGSDRDPLILVHGNMMIIAWLYLVSLAIMIARNFKPSWEGSMIMGDKVWFFSGNLHPILGVTAVVLGVFQPIMALFRCHPEEPNRYIFNWMHWGNGNTAHLFSVTTIVFATGLKKANLGGSKWFLPVLALFVTFYVIIQLVLQIQRSMTQSAAAPAAPLAVGVDAPLKPENPAPAAGPLSPAGPPNPPAADAAPPAPAHPPAADAEQKKEGEPPAPGAGPLSPVGPQAIPPASIGGAQQRTAVPGQEGEGFRNTLLALYAAVSLVFAGILCGIVCTSAPPK
ncbi:hypothetical protein HPB50_016080 [Hyalomma asiaticum]|uniref:Uncharacterized protein n=1 Tax=Hyalomma asiaticum TaxID=266040 RepID=A0ACB7T4U3_HYAAI|nr:hypothetical protein HPB50_016080 [Hyalomma asiaticum]